MHIGSPSFADHSDLISTQEDDIREYQRSEEKWSEIVLRSPTDVEAKKELEYVRRKIAQSQQIATLAAASDRKIGTVFATSGFTIHGRRNILDWALVELLPGLIGNNQVSAKVL